VLDVPPIAGADPAPLCALPFDAIDLPRLDAAFGVALHMHQPTVLRAGDLSASPLISNLQHMFENLHDGDNHNAPVFLHCYARPAALVAGLVSRGKGPRLMLDYSGNLLWGLVQMQKAGELEALARTTRMHPHVEWLGTMWSHAVAPSTPIPDLVLHMRAWRSHFAALFGVDAVRRVRGFSPPEMHLPIHPDVCFEYVRALRSCGYLWLLVQEDTIEQLDGTKIGDPHLPKTLVARSSDGRTETITALVKTQGSDTKLVGQMQPFAEARSLGRRDTLPYVVQIGDGENGGVMMNEFPSAYERAFDAIGAEGVVALNGSEYLGLLDARGVREGMFERVQPIGQHRIWSALGEPGPGAADRAIAADPSFNLDRASWTSDRSWVKGYKDVLDPIIGLSSAFHERWDGVADREASPAYREALLYVLLSQTSCFRYWGHGYFTDVAAEICRRGMQSVSNGPCISQDAT
jgi:hypothetical protein